MNDKSKSELIIVGGANGSGKTTFAREIVAQTGIEYLGADEIAAGLNPATPEKVAIEAARIFSRRFDEYIKSSESVLVESTLSGLSLRKFLRAAKEKKFFVSESGSSISILPICASGALPPELRRAGITFPTKTCSVASDARTRISGMFIKTQLTNGT